MSSRDKYIDKLAAKLKKWDAELDKFETRAKQSKGNVEADVKRKIDELKQKKKDVSKQLDAVKKASDDAWEDLKGGVDESLEALSTAFDKAKSHF